MKSLLIGISLIISGIIVNEVKAEVAGADTNGTVTYAQMTAPDTTAAWNVRRFNTITWQYIIAAINTNVVVEAQGCVENTATNWFNLNSTESQTTKTANGTYGMKTEAELVWTRFIFVSESGGTNATILCKLRGGN